jgi:hypothetical protein
MEIKFGFDPEVFFRNPTTGQFVSVHNIVPGTKAEPHKIDDDISVQVDGLSCEFNTRPTTDKAEAVKLLMKGLNIIENTYCKPNGLEMVITPVADFSKEYLDSLPDSVKELGCEPDYNAWTGKVNPRPDGAVTFRTGSGHIHIGFTEGEDTSNQDFINECCVITKELDFVVGFQSLAWDENFQRRDLYGKPGAFRPKPYGLEYRVLSNAFLVQDYKDYTTKDFNPEKTLTFEILFQIERMINYMSSNKYESPSPAHQEVLEGFMRENPVIYKNKKYGDYMRSSEWADWVIYNIENKADNRIDENGPIAVRSYPLYSRRRNVSLPFAA